MRRKLKRWGAWSGYEPTSHDDLLLPSRSRLTVAVDFGELVALANWREENALRCPLSEITW